MATKTRRPRATTGRPRLKPWHPFVAQGPPSGSYDPGLDAQVSAAGRGYQDLQDQFGSGQNGTPVGWQTARDIAAYGDQKQQLELGRDRTLTDLGTGATRAGEDRATATQNLVRRFGILGNTQRQAANAAGVFQGGALLQAAAKRKANQALEQAPVDTAYSRFMADNKTSTERTTQDSSHALGQLALQSAPPDASNPQGGYTFQDNARTLVNAGRENSFFGLDTEAQKAYQAAGAGWDPGQRPRGEFVDPQGHPYRVAVQGTMKYRYDPSGHILSQSRRPASRIRRR